MREKTPSWHLKLKQMNIGIQCGNMSEKGFQFAIICRGYEIQLFKSFIILRFFSRLSKKKSIGGKKDSNEIDPFHRISTIQLINLRISNPAKPWNWNSSAVSASNFSMCAFLMNQSNRKPMSNQIFSMHSIWFFLNIKNWIYTRTDCYIRWQKNRPKKGTNTGTKRSNRSGNACLTTLFQQRAYVPISMKLQRCMCLWLSIHQGTHTHTYAGPSNETKKNQFKNWFHSVCVARFSLHLLKVTLYYICSSYRKSAAMSITRRWRAEKKCTHAKRAKK